jgi:flagellar biosynthetic protein FlhB
MAGGQESDLEKTEPATPKKLEKAREDGQVARSPELTTFIVLLISAGGVWFMGSGLMGQMSAIMKKGLQMERELAFDSQLMIPRLGQLASDALLALLPLFGILVVAALFAPMMLSGWLFSAKAIQPDFKRINPMSGLGRMFSKKSVIELIKAVAKALVIGGVGALVIWNFRDAVLSLASQSVDLGITHMGNLLGLTFFIIVGSMLLIVLIDVPFQIWDHAENLKMTKEEVRKEMKESEGDPHVKARIRSLQREASRKRMMAEIPKADVIITNPTHYAVALRYQDSAMSAPKVVAKGSHLLAARIRELGQEHSVPILESPRLARALYHHAEIGDEIPETLYTAVAEVLAYVFQLRRYREYGGAAPQLSQQVLIPDEMDPLGQKATSGDEQD